MKACLLVIGAIEILLFPIVLYLDARDERRTGKKSCIFKRYSFIVSLTALIAVCTK